MRVVLDTNVVVSALLHQGPTRRFLELWRSRRIGLYASQVVLDEYVRVFHYPKFGLTGDLAARVLTEHLLPFIHKVEEGDARIPHPPKDPHDEPFLRTALACKARVLVSGDPHLTGLNGRYPFSILAPGPFLLKYFKGKKGSD